MRISEIVQVIAGKWSVKTADHEIQHLIYDSRKSAGQQDELFIALKGHQHDGHQFIPELAKRGVKNFLVSKIPTSQSQDVNIIMVSDVLHALQQLVAAHRSSFDIPVIGITGSNGKTIVKEWLSALLSEQWSVIKSPKSYNSQIGVPLSVWEMDSTHEVGVFEAGISEAGEMAALADVIQPSIGIFTNLGEAHNQGFSNRQEKLVEKATLFKTCQQVVCRIDHAEIVEHLSDTSAELISWGINRSNASINFEPVKKGLKASFGDQHYELSIQWTNSQDVENLLHAVATAILMGEQAPVIQRAIDHLKPVPMRLVLKRGLNNTYILDDTYNNDLLGLNVALDYLAQQPQQTNKTVILSDILQSGKSPKTLYRAVNDLMVKNNISKLIGIGTDIMGAQDLFDLDFQGYNSVEAYLKTTPVFSDELVLVKGARQFGLEKIVTYLEEKSHGTVLEVNYEAIAHNLNSYRSQLAQETKLMVMVKAFAYGVGVEEIAHLLQYHKVDYLGVAYLDEAINLRRKGITLPIMIMNVGWESFGLLQTFDLEPEIYSLQMLRRFIADSDQPAPIHLKIETGMNRLGFGETEIDGLLSILSAHPDLRIAGIFTHFSSADSSAQDSYTLEQAQIFDRVYQKIADSIGYKPIKHAVNSAGIVRWSSYHYDMVRLGIGLYGFDSSSKLAGLKTISTLKTRISQIKNVKEGESIGYSRNGRAERDSAIATIAIGYADGYTRLFGNGRAYVMVNGQQAYTIGNICMDMTMIDVTGLMAKEGDEVIVFGEKPSITELAHWSSTIPYEVLTNVSQRVKRVFVSE